MPYLLPGLYCPSTSALDYTPPTPEDIRALLRLSGLSGRQMARRLGVSIRQWRYYTDPTNPARAARMPWAQALALFHLATQARETAKSKN